MDFAVSEEGSVKYVARSDRWREQQIQLVTGVAINVLIEAASRSDY